MILNASGRTDIAAFYSEWFFNRIDEGFFDVRNPFNERAVSRILLSDVDAVIFCTKNPLPIVGRLSEVGLPAAVQVTLTPYKSDIEPFVPDKRRVIDAVKALSKEIGMRRVRVRYDPILLNRVYTPALHLRAFSRLCEQLDGCVNRVIISFVDDCKNTCRNRSTLALRDFTEKELVSIADGFGEIAERRGMTVTTCCEDACFEAYGFKSGECVSADDVFELTGTRPSRKWAARPCGCSELVDIGAYNSCPHLCRYCYANYDERAVARNALAHDPRSSLLVGTLSEFDDIKPRKR